MAGLTSIRRVFEEERVYKVDDRISGGRIHLSMCIKVGMLNDTLEMSVDEERL
jgi:hypothetical protein